MKGKSCFWMTPVFVIFFQIVLVSAVAATIRIMPVGDSITRGSSSGVVPEDNAYYVSYRKALWDNLVAAGYDIDFVGSLNSGAAVFSASEPADHEGQAGWRDDEILNGRASEPEKGKLIEWLITYQPDIVLLHIGTNGLEPNPDDVEGILDVIDLYSLDVWVVLARIINRSCITDIPPCSQSLTTTLFNNNITAMAQNRIDNLGDKIILVDMENGAGLDYGIFPAGDMWDNLHPFETGYAKMADLWFTALQPILPFVEGTDVVLESIAIEGPPLINENSRADYNCRAYYTNVTDRLVMADTWDDDSAYAAISDTGRLTTIEVPADEPVRILASYAEEAVTINTTYDVLVKNTPTQTLTSQESRTGSVSQGQWAYYRIAASASDPEIMVELTNLSANVNLYVLGGFQPTLTDYDCRPLRGGTTAETCILQNSGVTTWYIGVHGYTAGSFTITATLPTFDDVPFGYWAEDYIYAIFNAGITTGCSQDPLLYCPQNTVNRMQMATFIVRALEGEPPANYCATGSPFPDVPPDHPLCKYIKRFSELEITTGFPDGTFRPNNSVTRAQMATFIVRALEGEPPTDYCATGSPFSDVPPDFWACGYIKRFSELGITTGYSDGTFRPDNIVNRAQMAAFLTRAFLE